jgi:hypothetical protein
VTSGATRTLTLDTPGQKAVLGYTAAVGQRPAVVITDQAWTTQVDAGLPGSAWVTFRGPEGTQREETQVLLNGFGSTGFVEGLVADVAGTWTVTIDPRHDSVGHVTYTPRLVRDITGSATAGQPKTVSITTPGQNARHTFRGVAGQRFGVEVSRASWTARGSAGGGDPAVDLRLIDPAGRQFGDAMRVGLPDVPTWVELDPWSQHSVLPTTGTWALEVDPVYGPSDPRRTPSMSAPTGRRRPPWASSRR